MPFVTKDTFTFNHAAQVDYPAWTPTQTKADLDARSEELRLALNVVVNALNATTAAGLVGAVAPTGLVGSDVQTILSALKTAIDGVALGGIPDSSLTDAKFSPANLKTIPYATTTNIGNAYSVTVAGLTALVDGYPLCVKFNAASTSAITVNPNSLGAISVVDYFGNAVTNVRLNLIANLRYDAVNGNFQLQGATGVTPDGSITDVKLSNTAGQIKEKVNTHTALTTAHGAVSTSTASTIALRDASGNLIAKQLKSDVAWGTPPLTVVSTTKVANLNVEMVDGVHIAGSGGYGIRGITVSTLDPSGGEDGDIWIKYI